MSDALILDPATLDPAAASEPLPARRFNRRLVKMIVILALVALAVAEVISGAGLAGLRRAIAVFSPGQTATTQRVEIAARQKVAKLTAGAQAEIVVAGDAAKTRNALIPVTDRPLEEMRGFAIAKAVSDSGAGPMGNALRCLTQAVYYEAATEPLSGRRAVAQVVLNRMRHPAYPHSVCGVVYQGWQRTTGCQFSFTCDGSLLRRPMAGPWQEAEAIARAALSGQVEASVGSATFYHADYVLPKWAFSLAKIGQIGRHIFYRFPGGLGDSRAFTGGYSGDERIPDLNLGALQARLNAEASVAGDAGLPADIVIAPPPPGARTSAEAPRGRVNPLKQFRAAARSDGDEPDGRVRPGEDFDVSEGPIPVSNSAASAH